MANELTVKDTPAVSSEILTDFTAFENAQRIGKMLTQSAIIPQNFQNNLPNVMVALEIAARIKMSPIVVMQNLNVIKGRPTWSSKYIIAALTTSRVQGLSYELINDGFVEIPALKGKKIENLKCRVIAKDKRTGEERLGPWVSMEMAVNEGWYGKDGSKWRTMPEVMIRYRAATFFASVYYPELSVGIDIEDETENAVVSLPSHETIASTALAEPEKEEHEVKKSKSKASSQTKEETPKTIVSPEADNDEIWNNFED